MMKLSIKNKSKTLALLLLAVGTLFFYGFYGVSMWQKASTLSSDGSISLSAFVRASEFLSENPRQDEVALVPMRDVFDALNPQMRDKLIDYYSLWKSVGIILQANTTKEEVLEVRSYFIDFLKENSHVKYVVRDWVDPYAKLLYEAAANDELMILISEVRTFPFTLSTGWSGKITIYERVQSATLFTMNFSFPPKQFSTLPRDVLVLYDSDGATIHKAVSRVGFYLPLEGGINVSKQSYLTMQFKPDVEELELTLVFYYDRNRDGRWSGYEIDYVESATFSQSELGWAAGEWHTVYQVIPKADDRVVQIGIILAGDKNGTITLRNLAVYTEMPFEN